MPMAGFCFADGVPANTVKQPKLNVRAAHIENFKTFVTSDVAVVFLFVIIFSLTSSIDGKEFKFIFENAAKKRPFFREKRTARRLSEAASFGNSHYHVPTNRNLGW